MLCTVIVLSYLHSFCNGFFHAPYIHTSSLLFFFFFSLVHFKSPGRAWLCLRNDCHYFFLSFFGIFLSFSLSLHNYSLPCFALKQHKRTRSFFFTLNTIVGILFYYFTFFFFFNYMAWLAIRIQTKIQMNHIIISRITTFSHPRSLFLLGKKRLMVLW